jgi:hypothetical protein
VSIYVPAPLAVAESGSTEPLNKALGVASRASRRIDSNNFSIGSLDVVEYGAIQRLCGVSQEVPIGDDGELEPATYSSCLPYDGTTGEWEGLKDGGGRDASCDGLAIELEKVRNWAQLDTSLVKSFTCHRSFLHLRFTCQLSSNILGDVGVQFAFRVDGRIIDDSAQGGSPSPNDPYTGMHIVDGPVFVRALVPVDDGEHTVEIVYRTIYMAEISVNVDEMTFNVLSRYLVISAEGAP